MDFINIREEVIGKEANKNFMPMQPGDVQATFADIDDLMNYVDFQPETTLRTGIGKFISWYQDHYQAKFQS